MTFSEWSKKKKREEEQSLTFKDWHDLKYGIEREDDIAPITTTKSTVTPNTTADEKKGSSWFKSASAFDDGYQFGDILKTVAGTGRDLTENISAGILGIGEKVVDAGAYLVGGVGGLLGADEFKKDMQDFIAKDLYDERELAKNWTPGDIITPFVTNKILGFDAEEYSVLGDKTDSLAQSGGELLGTVALKAAGVPWFVTTGVTSFGGAVEGASNEGATFEEAGLSAAVTMGAEILTEKLFGGSGLEEKGLINLEPLTKGISNKVVKALADIGVDMAAEGSEEVVSSVMSRLGSSLYKEESLDELLLSEEAVDEYIDSFIGGAVLGGVMNTGKTARSIKTGRDYRTGLTENEQKVFDRVYNERLAEAEKSGQELTKKKKAELYDSVLNEMQKGYISTDTIEEELGGETYKSYKDTIDNEEAVLKEYEELGKKQNATLAEQARYAELQAKVKEIQSNSKRSALKTQLSDEVYNSLTRQVGKHTQTDNYLLESYNERARRAQAYDADLSQYDTKSAEVIKKAVESGILNNTRRTHEFVDMVAKISADKGVLFDFTNNAKLKESGFAIDGKAINGYVTKDGISVNIDSHKSLNSVVGHEISHVLEGTELYTELQTAMFEYAKSKKDYDGRRKSLEELYKNVEGADIDAELTADLVGDYLFTDADFINNLSTKHRNVFQKIYDEIKYLLKVTTAGSKEARELEKVKRAFDKAYKESGKVEGNTQYSMSEDGNLGYHAGDLGKAESLGSQGRDRGTGHFGRGTYFVGNKELVKDYNKRDGVPAPQHAVDFTDYNLYKVKNDKDGYGLHNDLKIIDGGIDRRWVAAASRDEFNLAVVTEWADIAEGKYGENKWNTEARIYGLTELAKREGIEIPSKEQYAKESGEDITDEYFDEYYDEYLYDFIAKEIETANEEYAEFRDAYFDLQLRFGFGDKVLNAMNKVLEYQAANDRSRMDAYKKDSLATVFMKSLGYEGVDTRGTELDNVAYGSVIYDLKENTVKYSLSDKKTIDKYTQKQYNDFGWARYADAITKNELDDMYSKIQEKGSLKSFSQSSTGEAIIEVNDKAHTTLGTNNVFVFVTGTKNNPQVNKVVRFQAETDTEMEIIKEKLYERGSFSNTYYSFLKQYGFAREYSKKSALDYIGYEEKVRRRNSGAESIRADRTRGIEQNGRRTPEQTQPNEIAPIKASSTDGVFFDGKKTKFSLSDSNGKQLTKEQSEYFKDSKMRDENGNLKVMYHGSQDAGFHEFNAKFSDDDTSFFFVDSNDVAASYSGTSETYEAQTIRTAEDMNNFIESIGAEGYEVVEKDGKFTLLYEGDRVADSKTAKGIYEEFCWYEGVGEGDANYKVYLNLTNPLEVDAEGRNWNNISREFSQEVYGRYKSLTAEEKAALFNLAEWGEYSIFRDEMLEARATAEQGGSGVFDETYTKNLARAYAKLGGANANLYDAFSIAQENFSEESLKEFAVKQMNTRDYAKKAKAEGYDGVIFKNIVDVGGYGNGSEGASTVAIAFESNQIKSVANENPTGNADIRYSLSEYTAEEKKAHNKAVLEHFGKTYSWAETGYLLLDGTRLDLSGKHDGAPGGYRTVDHRDITEALGYDYGGGDYSGSLVQFMSEGNIRIIPECNGINLSVKPTKEQEQALSNYISRYRGEVLLDIDDLNGNTVVSVEYPYGTYYTTVLNDIREWFDNGKKPENSGSYSLTKDGETPKRYGNYNVFGEDVRLEVPIQEEAAPVNETTSSKMEQVAPTSAQNDISNLELEHKIVKEKYMNANRANDAEGIRRFSEQLVDLEQQISQAEASLSNTQEVEQKKRKPSKAALAKFTKKEAYSGGFKLQGAYNVDGKQYLSDGNFVVEFNDIDENIPHNKDFPIGKLQSFLNEAVDGQSTEKYNIDFDKIVEINRANKGNRAFVSVGGTPFDSKYIEAVMRAIPNSTFALSDYRGGLKTLVAVGDNGKAMLMPVRAGENLNTAYEAQEIKSVIEDFAPTTLEDATAAREANTPSLDDMDAPPEMEAPYYGESENIAPSDPFEERDIKEVGNRKVKAYMYENPEVKSFFQAEANIMLGELRDATRGERYYTAVEGGVPGEYGSDSYGIWTGTSRHASADISYLLDNGKGNGRGYTYDEIEAGLKAIIEDNGKENNACSKRIEFILNDRLLNGYQDFTLGFDVPPNQDYVNLLNEKQIIEYSEEARKKFFETADEYAPLAAEEDIAPIAPVENVAPAKEQYEAIKPQREPKPKAEPRLKRVKEGDSSPGKKERKWIGTSTESEAVDGKILPEDLNQEAIHYQPISNEKTLNKANTKLNGMGYEASVAYFNSQFANKNTTLEDIVLGERLIQEAIKRGDTQTAGKLIEDVAILGTELGQKVQALSIIKRLTPEGQLRMLQRTVERGKTKGDKAYEGVEITQEMIDHILKTYGKDGTYDQAKLNEAVEDVKKQIAKQMNVTKLDKVNAWRYLSMLGNPKTHIRNLVSNVAMRGTTAVKNVVARTIESIAPISNRTKTWEAASEDVKAFAQQTTIEMKDILSDGGKYSEDASIKQKRAIFKNKVLNGVYEFNSDMLSKEDWWFSKPAFTNALSEYLTANGIRTKQDIINNPKIVEKAKQYATEQSQIATFRQYSWLANKINDIEKHNTVTNIAVGAVLPFKKTPINIAKTALNYSPLGFTKTLTYDAAQVKNGKMEASTLVDHLAQNITGTALTLIGYWLASSGFINGGGEDDKEGKYDYQLGEQAYSINIGGATFSLSWLSPIAMPLFVGANAYEQLVEGKEWNGDVVVETLAQTLDPLSEMSFLSGLDSVLSSYDSGIEKFAGIGQSAAQNYITQFAPTLSSQVAAVMDDTKRSTKVAADSNFKFVDETINKLKYKIPFLRETLEPTTDIWGNEVKQTENIIARAIDTFIAPYSRSEDISSDIDEEIKALYKETGDSGLIPSIPYNYINYDGEKYEMSADEYTEYKKIYGQTAYELLTDLFDTSTYQNATSEERADMVNKVYDFARDEAKREYFATYGVEFTNAEKEGVEYYKENSIKGAIENDMTPDEYEFSVENPEKYQFLQDNGVTYEEYQNGSEEFKDAYSWAYKNPDKYTMSKAVANDVVTYRRYASELYDIKADKDENGKSISGSRKEKVIDYVNNLDIDYGARLILFKNEYNADDTYNYEIIDYLNSREDISYEEMAAILKELGFAVSSDGTITWD